MTPYYDDGRCVIYHGDCWEVLPQLAAVDAVLTDPPYGVAKAEWDVELPIVELGMAARIAPVMGIMPGLPNLVALPARLGPLAYKWTLAARLVNGMTRGAVGFGNWIACMVYLGSDASIYRADQDCREFVVGREEKPDHPSPKPLNVTTWFLDVLGGASVLDPFAGSGTTLVAAKALGKRAIGIEREERYCEVAAKRLSQEVLPLSEEAS